MGTSQKQETILYQNYFWLFVTYAKFSSISRPQQRWHRPRLTDKFACNQPTDKAGRVRPPTTAKAIKSSTVNGYLLANHISCVLVNEAGRSMASETFVHFAFVSLKPGGTHTLHVSTAGQRAGLGCHAVVMTDVCLGRLAEEMRNQNYFTVSRSVWNCTGF